MSDSLARDQLVRALDPRCAYALHQVDFGALAHVHKPPYRPGYNQLLSWCHRLLQLPRISQPAPRHVVKAGRSQEDLHNHIAQTLPPYLLSNEQGFKCIQEMENVLCIQERFLDYPGGERGNRNHDITRGEGYKNR